MSSVTFSLDCWFHAQRVSGKETESNKQNSKIFFNISLNLFNYCNLFYAK